jgi:hypoxanthine phosphoribosyltransferase
MTQFKKRLLFDEDTIRGRVKELAGEIAARHPDGDIVFIGILKGSFVFLADLVRCLNVDCQIDFARIASYGSETVSSGKLEIKLDAGIPVKDRAVIIVDDIVDTGLTLSEYRKRVEERGPKSVEIAALIDKTGRREKHVDVDYCGFRIEEGFVVGYGLDCDECFRYLGSVCVLEEE